MKKFFIVLVLLFIFPSLVQCESPSILYEDKPDIVGFRDMRWGDSIDKFSSEMIEIRKPYNRDGEPISVSTRRYERKNEELQMGKASIGRIEYVFFKNKLSGVFIFTETYSDWCLINQYLATVYKEDSESNYWQGKNGHIKAIYFDSNDRKYAGFTGFFSDISLRQF